MFTHTMMSGGHNRSVSLIEHRYPDDLSGPATVMLWKCDGIPQLDSEVVDVPAVTEFFPNPGGARFLVQSLPAGYGVDIQRSPSMDYENAQMTRLQGLDLSTTMYEAGGYHYTNTIDCGAVLAGSVWIIGPDGNEAELTAGDTFIDIGAPHAWENRSTQPCTYALFILGAERSG